MCACWIVPRCRKRSHTDARLERPRKSRPHRAPVGVFVGIESTGSDRYRTIKSMHTFADVVRQLHSSQLSKPFFEVPVDSNCRVAFCSGASQCCLAPRRSRTLPSPTAACEYPGALCNTSASVQGICSAHFGAPRVCRERKEPLSTVCGVAMAKCLTTDNEIGFCQPGNGTASASELQCYAASPSKICNEKDACDGSCLISPSGTFACYDGQALACYNKTERALCGEGGNCLEGLCRPAPRPATSPATALLFGGIDWLHFCLFLFSAASIDAIC
jgi:hypothetical protein